VTLPTTTAIFIERHGPPAALVEREVRLRDPGPAEVHLRVEAAGVNFADLLMRAGLYHTVPPRPYSPGFEIAGVVARAGSAAADWEEGDRAVALLRHGGYARDIVVQAGNLFRYPKSLTAVQAAAVPVAFLTAHVCLFEAGNARPGETVLVLNAAGGVGTAAVQLAVRQGLRVIGTAGSPAKRAFVARELGAESCLDSRAPWKAEVETLVGPRGIDLALDAVGGEATAACRRLLAPLGRLVFYGLSDAMPGGTLNWPRAAWAWLRTPWFHPLSLIEPNIGVFGVHLLHLQRKEAILGPLLRQMYGAVADGRLRPIIDRTFPLSRAGAVAAHRYLHDRKATGKVVLAAADGETLPSCLPA
jgi:NADPH:quinone reductase-like Zn-dependent oxidoreductase